MCRVGVHNTRRGQDGQDGEAVGRHPPVTLPGLCSREDIPLLSLVIASIIRHILLAPFT